MLLTYIIGIYIAAAVIPAIFLLVYIYNHDTVEKEPAPLLIKLFFMGALATLISMVLEEIGESILNHFISQSNPLYVLFLAFLVVGIVEEGSKFFLMSRMTWNDPNFNYRFDAIVYSACVSLGFAAFENIGYVFSYGLTVAPTRAVLAIPGHLSFSVFMGYFYGRAKLASDSGNSAGAALNKVLALASSVFLHGFYDSCAMKSTSQSTVIFLIFVVIMFFAVFRLVRHESRTDSPV